MRLLIVRHGAPDYRKDTLTAQGWKEAELLAPYLVRKKPDLICLSSLGRAQDTAKETLRQTGLTPLVFPWLCEFECGMTGEFAKGWHTDPAIWTREPEWCGPHWKELPPFADSVFLERYEADKQSLDSFLAEHGYVRKAGKLFSVAEEFYDVNETIVFFCHLGRGLTLLSQLLDMPWCAVAHQFWLPTSSITEVIFERSPYDRGTAIARCASVGSVPHLDTAGVARCNSGFMMPIDGYTRAHDAPETLAK